MKKKSNLDILMIMFGFTFFSGSMLIGQKLSSGVEFLDFLVCILIGGTILGIFGGILGYIGAKTGNNMKELSHKSFGKKGSYLPSLLVGITQIGWYGVGISMFAVPVANLIFPNNIFALYSLLKIDHKKIILFTGLSSTIFSYYLYNNFIDFLSIMNYALPPIGVVLIINYIAKKDYSSKNINFINCIAVIIGGISAYFLKFGISSINAIIVTSLITIVGNYINNKIIINKGGNSS